MDLVDDVFFLLRAEPHVPMWPFFIHQRQKKIVVGGYFFGFPNPLKSKVEKNPLDQLTKIKNSHRLKIRNWVPNCSACKTKIVRKKKLSETWIDSRFFSFSTVDNRQRISAPCSKKFTGSFFRGGRIYFLDFLFQKPTWENWPRHRPCTAKIEGAYNWHWFNQSFFSLLHFRCHWNPFWIYTKGHTL